MRIAKTLAIALLAVPVLATAAPLPTADELRSLFVVEQQPLDTHLFGMLLIRNQLDARATLACDLRRAHPTALVLTDQEGGIVRDLKNVEPPPAPWEVAGMTADAFSQQVQRAGQALADACIDVDDAPVAEVFNGERSYSNDPKQAASYAARFATAMQNVGIAPVLKHYPGKLKSCKPVSSLPGYQLRKGSHEVETCPGSATDVWRMADAFPVQSAPMQSAPMVMMSNRVYPGVSSVPAVLDPMYVQRLRKAGFRGLVMTDALWEISNRPQTVVQALKAGADVILLPQPRQVDEAMPYILAALQSGDLDPATMRDRLDRVAAFKAAAIARRKPAAVYFFNSLGLIHDG
ncbi:glycoside hydrolase family 3 N-terminal domain-containing protein [Burkholderia gladioli]|uniref:glycoside hydrolase family 3 N-terminal domain-containing protein n=1 Tax=Burkholderia gladioli TaxID=28095 RepID=UPI00163F3B8F|nr:glycoside hydrolase family 3 N-terminal domain-containing protein [Burkholderia gladioli]